jgi:hypothetical protein
MTNCECENPGTALYFECQRHGCRKHAAWWRLCRTREEYFRAWEEGRGPGQGKPWDPSQPSRGLGDTIAKVTTAVGIRRCGGCKKRQAQLNRLVPYVQTEEPPKP